MKDPMHTFTDTRIHMHSKRTASIRHNAAFLLSKTFLLVFFSLMLLHPRSSIRFASDGLILWYQTVVPTLLPCMLLSSLMVQTDAAFDLISLIHPFFGRLLGTSPEGTYCFLIGLLCGYPMGAKTCADMIRAHKLSLEEGTYLMAFLHFPSPMFVTGYIASTNLILPSSLPIFAAIYLPVIPLSLLSRWKHSYSRRSFISAEKEKRTRIRLTPAILDQAITSSSAVMLKIGIYMMIFTILAGFANMLPLPPSLFLLPSESLLSAFCGMLEMTTGIRMAAQTALSSAAQGSLICFAASFGGLSVAMQIQAVLTGSGLSLKHYLPWQLLHSIFAVIFYLIFYTWLLL